MSGNRKIFLFVSLPLVVVFIIIAALLIKDDSSQTPNNTSTATSKKSDDQPAPLKNLGFKLDHYDAATKKAGDFHITPELKKIVTSDPTYEKQAWRDYGIQDIRSPNDPTKRNVQPTFYLPLGTEVLAPIDGVVTMVETLYSNDYTIWFSSSNKSTWSYETEHVKNVTVKVGEKVTAGQVVAEVSDYETRNTPGYGLVELGLFHPQNNEPTHWCPFQYLDSSIKDDTNKKILSVYKGWEEFMGDTAIYDEASYAIPGCATLEPTKG